MDDDDNNDSDYVGYGVVSGVAGISISGARATEGGVSVSIPLSLCLASPSSPGRRKKVEPRVGVSEIY